MGNAVGKGNRHWFIIFLWMELYAFLVSCIIGAIQIQRHMNGNGWSASSLVWMIVFEAVDAFVGLSTCALAVAQASQVARNITTNELANWHRWGMHPQRFSSSSKVWRRCAHVIVHGRITQATSEGYLLTYD